MCAWQQWKQLKLNVPKGSARNPDSSSEAFVASRLGESPTGEVRLMESILERENMNRAYQQVVSNKGAPGVDGMKVGQLRGYMRRHWPKIEKGPAGRFLRTDAGKAQGNRQARGRGAAAWDSDGPGPADPQVPPVRGDDRLAGQSLQVARSGYTVDLILPWISRTATYGLVRVAPREGRHYPDGGSV